MGDWDGFLEVKHQRRTGVGGPVLVSFHRNFGLLGVLLGWWCPSAVGAAVLMLLLIKCISSGIITLLSFSLAHSD